MRSNRGIVISGGTQTVDQMVAGEGASAHMLVEEISKDPTLAKRDLSEQLDELIRALQDHQPALPESDYLVGDARRVATEVTKPEPDKKKVSSLLQVLEDGTKGFASIASIVSSIKILIGVL